MQEQLLYHCAYAQTEFHEVDAARWEILSACSRAEAARNPAGAWFGEQVRKPIRAWIANLRYVGTSAMRRRSDYWAILKGTRCMVLDRAEANLP